VVGSSIRGSLGIAMGLATRQGIHIARSMAETPNIDEADVPDIDPPLGDNSYIDILLTAHKKNPGFGDMTRSSTFPLKKKQTLRWVTEKIKMVIADGSGASTIRQPLRANQCVNPGALFTDTGGGGTPNPQADTHEPMGWSQLSAIYAEYYVEQVRVRVDYFLDYPVSDTDPKAIIVGLCPLEQPDRLTVNGHYEELPLSTWTVVGPEGVGKLMYSLTPNRFFGVPDKQVPSDTSHRWKTDASDESTDQVAAKNPLWLHLFTHHVDATDTDGYAFRGMMTVEYDVVFCEPKALVQS